MITRSLFTYLFNSLLLLSACVDLQGLKRYLTPPNRSHPSPLALMFSGGMGGVFCWLSVYPVDMVKSRMQTDFNKQYSGTLDCTRKIVAKEGVRGLYKGFGVALIRAFPANAACFLAYEFMFGLLGHS